MSGAKILAGMRQAAAYAKGQKVEVRQSIIKTPAAVDVKAIRERLGLSQAEFAHRFGFTVDSVQNWEQGHRKPQGPARVLLKVIEKRPDAVMQSLEA